MPVQFELRTLEEYSDEALIAEIRRVVHALGGQRLTRNKFNAMARVHSSTVSKRFGSWIGALDKAGIGEDVAPRFRPVSRQAVLKALRDFAIENPGQSITEEAMALRFGLYRGGLSRRFGKWEDLISEVGLAPVPLGRRYTDEECFENVLALWTHYGRQPSFDELKHPPSTVGPKAYIRRWGGWRPALSAFVRKVNEPGGPPLSEPQPQSVGADSDVIDESASIAPVPRSMSLSLRYRVLSRDNFRCVACGASPAKDGNVELHVDHIHPWSRGGKNAAENLRTLCAKCNLGKGARVEASAQA